MWRGLQAASAISTTSIGSFENYLRSAGAVLCRDAAVRSLETGEHTQ